MKKKVIALLLAGLTVLSLLAGCGNKTEEEDQYQYIPTYHELLSENGEPFENGINARTVGGDVMYFYTYEYNTVSADTPGAAVTEDVDEPADGGARSELAIYRVNLDGTGLTRLPDYHQSSLDEGMEGYVNINAMEADSQGRLWVLEQVEQYYYDLPEDFDPETDDQWNYYTDAAGSCKLMRLGDTGAVEYSVDLRALYQEQRTKEGYSAEENSYFWAYSFLVDGNDNAYVYAMNYLMVISPDGKLKACSSDDQVSDNLFCLSDGRIAINTWDGGPKIINAETAELTEEELPVPENYNYVNLYYGGSGDYLYFYATSSSLYGMKADGTVEQRMDWLDCDVDSDYYSIEVVNEQRLATVESDWSGEVPKTTLVTLDRTLVAPENRRTELTLACFNLNWTLRRAVKAFNRSNTEYRIRVKDYSEYSTDDNYEAGLQKLSTEIISGDVPDILACDNLPIRQYAAKGLLEDLTPFIEQDEKIGADGLVKSVADACRSDDGELYYVASQFYIRTALADKRMVGDVTGITPAEAMDYYQNKLQPDSSLMGYFVNRETLMEELMGCNLEHYVNWETGECSFDSESFANLLEIVKTAPEEIDDEWYNSWNIYGPSYAMKEGRQLLSTDTISDWYSMLYVLDYVGDNGVFVGVPDEERAGNCFELNYPIAMSSKSKHQDAVWAFISDLLTNEEYFSWGFSTVQSRLNKTLAEARVPQSYEDGDGNIIEYPVYSYEDENGEIVDVYCLTDEMYNDLLSLINDTHRVYDYDRNIMDIVTGEVDAFLKGSSSAQEVAAIIQNRVSLYVNENR